MAALEATSAIVVRDATPDDRAVIVEFNRLLALETEDKRLDPAILDRGVALALADPDRARYWVAEIASDGGTLVVGQTAITREWSDWRNGWIWWLQSVYVAAEHRGRGVFRQILAHIRDRALAAPDVLGVRLYVEDNNHRARDTYESLGMKPAGYSVLEELWLHRSRPG